MSKVNSSLSLDRFRLGVLGRDESVPPVDEALEGERYMLGRFGEGEKAEGDIRSDPARDGALEAVEEIEKEEVRQVDGE